VPEHARSTELIRTARPLQQFLRTEAGSASVPSKTTVIRRSKRAATPAASANSHWR